MRFAIWLAASLALLSPAALAEPLIPDKRLVVSRNTDFPGADLRSIFDTSLAACERACLTDQACRAFTYNERSAACFPKSEVRERAPFEGALSARVIDAAPGAEDLAARRSEVFAALSKADLDAARGLAGQIGYRHAAGGWTAEDLVSAAIGARSDGDPLNAYRFLGAALSLTDAGDQWTEYARLALELAEFEANGNQKRAYRETAVSSALNGYLRAEVDPGAVSALATLAEAFEKTGRGRDMIPALRLAQSLSPREDIALRLDDAIGKYGFRIVESQVESDQAAPRVCAVFSEALAPAGVDYDPFVQRDVSGLTVQADDRQLCIDGVVHGERYRLTFRAGLPAENGERLVKPVTLNLYVRDRTPAARFPGRAYVLPKGGDTAVPITTVNLDRVELRLRRVSDRNLLRAIQENYFGRPLAAYEEEIFAADIAEEIWTGTGEVESSLNRDVTTRLPLGDIVGALAPGIYALQARVPGADIYDTPAATQWFVVSDLGISTFEGTEGLHVVVRGLAAAEAKPGVTVTLLSRANAVLATMETDQTGYARFPAGLTRGTGGAAPALVMVEDAESDLAFLSLTDPAFDLSDRGVEGRPAAPPIDVFLTTDRGAYRAGETVHATALTRDSRAQALADLPLTAVLTRPDGVEYSRALSQGGEAGGHVFALPLGAGVPRGTWRLATYVDVDAPPLSETRFLVEDFLPERIDVTLALPDGPIAQGAVPALDIEARYLFGAAADDLAIEGDLRVVAGRSLEAWPGYVFGRHDEIPEPAFEVLPGGVRTDASGEATIPLVFPMLESDGHPLALDVTVRVSEGSGRPVERQIRRPLRSETALVGLRAQFDGVVPEGAEAAFDVIVLDPSGQPAPAEIRWSLSRIETRYQWYALYGNWNWEPVTTRTRVATGTLVAEGPTTIAAPVEWGRYELTVELVGGAYAATSTTFYAGWYAPADASATPDTLEVALDKSAYAPGETARLRVVPRAPGTALVTVLGNRLIDMKIVELGAAETTIDLPVTDEWGAGAYVTATLLRPLDGATGRTPTRSLGLAYAPVDPGPRRLEAAFDAPAEAIPREPLDVSLEVSGIAEGETVYATIAAVDVGILNLTGFASPDPDGHYFGQRRLGVGLRDIYGRLIDATTGAMGQIRSGGDSEARMRREAEPPTEELVSFFSGTITVENGVARARFDLPAFNGTVRLMAVIWSDTGVGQAEADVLVRDPVVVTASLPRFLAPGDTARLLLELTHATGPAGNVGLAVSGPGVDATGLPAEITLTPQGKGRVEVPITGAAPGRGEIRVAVTTPEGQELTKTLNLPVRVNDPVVSRINRVDLADGQTFNFDRDVFAGFMPGTTKATLAAGPLARLNAPGLLASLDRFPYGCTEQIASRALPLLYFDDVARAMDLDEGRNIAVRIEQAIDAVLTNQAASGSFGLWRPSSGDFWLDAYVTDFLSRARAQGYAVPDKAFRSALDNLANRVNYAPDFDRGGEDIAYALYVLAREGAASMGDLRYYADVKSDALATALAQAQLGSALAAYGDQTRADALFARAATRLDAAPGDEAQVWRSDYGTRLRDVAGVLTLAVEAGSNAVDRARLANQMVRQRARARSTQESAWSLLAAHALIEDLRGQDIEVNGVPLDGPLVRVLETPGPVSVANRSGQDTVVTLTTFGVPEVPAPAGGNGYAITRDYYTLDGEAVTLTSVPVGERLVAVLTITPFEAGEARLMVSDPLPAGFEIDNPNLIRGGDIRALDWLELGTSAEMTEAREDRFLAAVDRRNADPFRLAYIVRAVSPGSFHHPPASVEDMYRPVFRANTGAGRVEVTE